METGHISQTGLRIGSSGIPPGGPEGFRSEANKRKSKLDKLVQLAKRVHCENNNNRARDLIKIVANSYEGNKEELKEFFDSSEEVLKGLAKGAYDVLESNFLQMNTYKNASNRGSNLELSRYDPEQKNEESFFSKYKNASNRGSNLKQNEKDTKESKVYRKAIGKKPKDEGLGYKPSNRGSNLELSRYDPEQKNEESFFSDIGDALSKKFELPDELNPNSGFG